MLFSLVEKLYELQKESENGKFDWISILPTAVKRVMTMIMKVMIMTVMMTMKMMMIMMMMIMMTIIIASPWLETSTWWQGGTERQLPFS